MLRQPWFLACLCKAEQPVEDDDTDQEGQGAEAPNHSVCVAPTVPRGSTKKNGLPLLLLPQLPEPCDQPQTSPARASTAAVSASPRCSLLATHNPTSGHLACSIRPQCSCRALLQNVQVLADPQPDSYASSPGSSSGSHNSRARSLNSCHMADMLDGRQYSRHSLQIMPRPGGGANPIPSRFSRRSMTVPPDAGRPLQADCHDFVWALLAASASDCTPAHATASGQNAVTEATDTPNDPTANILFATFPSMPVSTASATHPHAADLAAPSAAVSSLPAGSTGSVLRSAAEQLLGKRSRAGSVVGASPEAALAAASSAAASGAHAPPEVRAAGGLMPSPLELLSGLSGLRFLAKGAFAHVYAASYQGLPVAAKLLACRELDRSSPVLREALLGRMLQHPNVVTAYATRVAHFDEHTLHAALLLGEPPSTADCSSQQQPHAQVQPQPHQRVEPQEQQLHPFRAAAGSSISHCCVARSLSQRGPQLASTAESSARRRPGSTTAADCSRPAGCGAFVPAGGSPYSQDIAASFQSPSRDHGPTARTLAVALPARPASASVSARPTSTLAEGAVRYASATAGGCRRAQPVGLRDALLSLGVAPGTYVCLSIMEYCDMGSLEALCAEDAFRPSAAHAEARLVHVALDVAKGLAYLHSAGLVHGDLKPANVLLRRQGSRCPATEPEGDAALALAAGRGPSGGGSTHTSLEPSAPMRCEFSALLSDFGLSQLVLGQPGESDSTASANIGTVTFASPERFEGCPLKAPADVYSFGIMLWQMATGCRPYKGLQVGQIIGGVLCRNLRPEWPAGRHEHLRPLYETCVAQDPTLRPTAEQLNDELQALKRGIEP